LFLAYLSYLALRAADATLAFPFFFYVFCTFCFIISYSFYLSTSNGYTGCYWTGDGLIGYFGAY
jgi:hypothetical protein